MDEIAKYELSDIVSSVILGISIMALGIRMLIPKPLIVSGRKGSIFIGGILMSVALARLIIQDLRLGASFSFLILFLVLFVGAYFAFRNWIFFSNVDHSLLRETVRDILTRKNVQFTESRNTIQLAESSTRLEFVYNSPYGSISLRVKGKLPAFFLTDLKLAYKNIRAPKIDWSALFLAFIGLFVATIQLSDFLPDNGVGMSSIPYGRPLTFGEEILEKTFLLVPFGFILWAIMGVVLGVRLLFRRPLMLSPWWFAIPMSFPSAGFVIRSVLSQVVYGFDFSDSMFALLMIVILFPAARYGWGYIVLDVAEKDFVECLKTVMSKHNLTYSSLDSRIMLGSEKSYVQLTSAELFTAIVHINSKTFPNQREFLSDLRVALGKVKLVGFPKMGTTILLISLVFLMWWLLPVGLGYVIRLFDL